MRVRFGLLTFMLVSAISIWAADAITPLNIKLGLWEVTSTHSMTGLPGIPPERLAKMSPEQRAQIEAAMGGMGSPKTEVTKDCVTKEKLEKLTAFEQNKDSECTRTVVNSSGSRLEMKIHCEGKRKDRKTVTDGTFVIESTSSEGAKGSMHAVANSEGRNMNIDFTFNSKYLGPSCGDVK